MIYISLFSLIFSLSSWAFSEVDDSYFKLHQATGFYEQYIGGGCPTGRQMAQKLINSMKNQKSDTEITAKARQLNKWVNSKKNRSTNELESFRLSIHVLQEGLSLHHENRWHDEIVAQCKSTIQ